MPTFVRQDITEIQTTPDALVEKPVFLDSWPTILILPFKNLTGDPDQDFLGFGISTELAIEVSRFENVRVLFPRDGIAGAGIYPQPRFVLNGELYKDRSGIKLTVYLVDTKSGIQIWGDICKTGANLADLHSFKEGVVNIVATKICGEFGIIPKAISREVRSKLPSELSTYYEALLQFWDPLIKASTLGLIGQCETGQKFVEKLLRLRPDFTVKGRMLIDKYIKFDEIADRVLEGLLRSGLPVN